MKVWVTNKSATTFLFSIGFNLLIYLSGYAEKPGLSEVQSLCKNFINFHDTIYKYNTNSLITLSELQAITRNKQYSVDTIAYIARLMPKGYLVVANNTDIEPIIAYSFESNTVIPLSVLIDDINLRLKAGVLYGEQYSHKNNQLWKRYIAGDVEKVTFYQWPEQGSTVTGGWIGTTWEQGTPYNDFCPLVPGNPSRRSASGCLATAMSQIINYHQ